VTGNHNATEHVLASILTPDVSTARDAALAVLAYLGVTDPPLRPEIVLGGLNLTQHPLPSFDLDRLTRAQRRTIGSVRRLLSPADARIYLSADLAPRQEPWVIYHETGHAAIAWHREVLYLDYAYTLDPSVRTLMEREANEFAGNLMFLGPRFAVEAADLPFGIGAAITLATRYDASIEATLRHYIETSTEHCVCNVFRIATLPDGQRTLTFRYFTRPSRQPRWWRFGRRIGEVLPPDDPLVILLNDGILDTGVVHDETRFDHETGRAYHEQTFSTGHAVFVVVRALAPHGR